MIILPIKKQWYDMILSGEKKEEYREIKHFYWSRFQRECYMSDVWQHIDINKLFNECKDCGWSIEVMFRNGYSAQSPSFVARCILTIGTGKTEWGAEEGKEYFVLTIESIKGGKNE